MSKAQPIPRKYKSYLDEAQDNLRCIAGKLQLVCEILQSDHPSVSNVCMTLIEMKALAYKTALELSEIEVATDCLAPSTTWYETELCVLADALERLADDARQSVKLRRGTKRQRTDLEV
ncbi:MAG: hypothetical protein U0350_48675 [Caldilineaceae bacterium]